MKRALAYERVRLLSVRSTWWLAGLSAGATALFSLALAALLSDPAGAVTTTAAEQLLIVLTRSPAGPVAAGVLGVLAAGQDERHGTGVVTLLVTPRRSVALGARALALATAAGALALLHLVVAGVVGGFMLGAGDGGSAAALVQAGAGFAVLVVGWGLAGLAIGVLVRSQAAGLVALLGAAFIAEPAVRLFLTSSGWDLAGTLAAGLPFAAGNALVGSTDPSGTAAVDQSAVGLAPLAGGAVFATYVALLLWGAVAAYQRQDV